MKVILTALAFSLGTVAYSDVEKSDGNIDLNAVAEAAELTKEQDLARFQSLEHPSEEPRIDKTPLMESRALRDYFNYNVKNYSTKTICSFYAVPNEDLGWGPERLGGSLVTINGSFNIDVYAGSCTYDFKAIFCNGDVVYGWDVDVCQEPLLIVNNSQVY